MVASGFTSPGVCSVCSLVEYWGHVYGLWCEKPSLVRRFGRRGMVLSAWKYAGRKKLGHKTMVTKTTTTTILRTSLCSRDPNSSSRVGGGGSSITSICSATSMPRQFSCSYNQPAIMVQLRDPFFCSHCLVVYDDCELLFKVQVRKCVLLLWQWRWWRSSFCELNS